MKLQRELEEFDRDARADLEKVLRQAEEFLVRNRNAIDELQLAVAQWRGEAVSRTVEHRALATVAALRGLVQAVAAGGEIGRELGDLRLPNVP